VLTLRQSLEQLVEMRNGPFCTPLPFSVAQEEHQSKQIVVYLKEFFVYHTAISKITILQIQWNLSNLTHQGTREICQNVHDVGILRFYFS
jgi:hypothetical protein